MYKNFVGSLRMVITLAWWCLTNIRCIKYAGFVPIYETKIYVLSVISIYYSQEAVKHAETLNKNTNEWLKKENMLKLL